MSTNIPETPPASYQTPHNIVKQLQDDVNSHASNFKKGSANLANLATVNSNMSFVPNFASSNSFEISNSNIQQQNAKITNPGILVYYAQIHDYTNLSPVVYDLPNQLANSALVFNTRGWATSYTDARNTFKDYRNFQPNPYTGNRMVTNVNTSNPKNWDIYTMLNIPRVTANKIAHTYLLSFWAQKKVNWTVRLERYNASNYWFSLNNLNYDSRYTGDDWEIVNIIFKSTGDATAFINQYRQLKIKWSGIDVDGGFISDFGFAMFSANSESYFLNNIAKYPCAITTTGVNVI